MDFVWLVIAGGLFAAGLRLFLEEGIDLTRRAEKAPGQQSSLTTALYGLGALAAGCAIGLTQLSSLYWLALACTLSVGGVVLDVVRQACSTDDRQIGRWPRPAPGRPPLEERPSRDIRPPGL